jgi:hypothetical protein
MNCRYLRKYSYILLYCQKIFIYSLALSENRTFLENCLQTKILKFFLQNSMEDLTVRKETIGIYSNTYLVWIFVLTTCLNINHKIFRLCKIIVIVLLQEWQFLPPRSAPFPSVFYKTSSKSYSKYPVNCYQIYKKICS